MLRGIVLAGIFALPFIVFIVAESLFFPFITGKNFAFRIIVEVMSGAWLALALVNPIYRPRRSWLLGAFALLVTVVALADALGVYPFKSFWSNFERMDGWVTLAHLFVYFIVAASILNTEKLWRNFWQVSLAVSGLVALYGFLQLAGIASLNPGFSSVARIDATFGNPIYLAAYMLFHVGIAAMLWARAWTGSVRGQRLWLSLVYGGIITLDTLVLFLTGTRGAMLGLLGGLVVGALLLALSSQGARKWALSAVICLVVLSGGFWLVRDAAWVEQVPFLERLATISLEDNTTKARFMNWGMAWEGVKERPILGWGQENYAIVFDKYYNPQMYAQEQWFDRVHNIIFDWLIAAGFLGLLSYLSIFVFALWSLWRPSVRRGSAEASTPNVKGSAFSAYERSILAGLLAAYFFHNLFVFDNIMSYLLFTTVLAYIAWRASGSSMSVPMPSVSPRLLPVVAVSAVVLVWGAAWYVNAGALAQNRSLLEALKPHEEGLTKNLEYFERSASYRAFGTQEVREQLAQAAAQVVRIESVPVAIKQGFLDGATREMVLMMQESPLNARFPLFLGVLLSSYGGYDQAAVALEKAHELSPGKQTILFELAANRSARGDTEGALATYKQAYDLAPQFLDARFYYVAAAIRMGEDALAEELLAPVVGSGGAADPRIAAAYVSRGQYGYGKIIGLWNAHIIAKPEDVQAYFTLAAAYYRTGDQSRAISTLEKVGSISAESKSEADALIMQIRSGADIQ